MTFMEEVASGADEIWQQCAKVSFLTEMGEGTLSPQRFLNYIVQDSIYLRDYLRVHAMALFKSRTLKEMKMFYSELSFVNDSENATRLKYLNDNDMTDDDVEGMVKLPACKAYTDFLLECAVNKDIPEILMALIPCMVGYYEVFRIIRRKYPQVMNSYFGNLVEDYTSDGYRESCQRWMKFTDDICRDLDEKRKEELKSIYLKSSMLELRFWKMDEESE